MALYWFNKNKSNFEEETDEEIKKEKISNFLDSLIKDSKNLNFLLGSGCSQPAIPLMKTMIELINKREELKEIILNYNSGNIDNLEEFLNWLNSAKHFFNNNSDNQKNVDYEKFNNAFDICKEIIISLIYEGMNNSQVSYDKTLINYINFYNGLMELCSLQEKNTSPKEPISVFTTNYDLFNEIALENCNFQYTTGFSGEVNRKFNVNNFRFRLVDSENRYKEKWDPYNAYIKIYKIHGSINWNFNDKDIIQVDFAKNNNAKDVIIYPTINKFNETLQSPYSQLFREFSIQLQKSHSTLIVIGYGFGDSHINELISQTLVNENFNLIIFGNIEEENIKHFKEQTGAKINLHFIGGTDSNEAPIYYFSNFVKLLPVNKLIKKSDNTTIILEEEKNA